MAVITQYIIIRNGVALEQVFDDKKEAEAYDKLLDAAEQIVALIKAGNLQIDADARTIDEIALFLAKNGQAVTQILKAIKPLKPEPEGAKTARPKMVPAEDKAQAKVKHKAA